MEKRCVEDLLNIIHSKAAVKPGHTETDTTIVIHARRRKVKRNPHKSVMYIYREIEKYFEENHWFKQHIKKTCKEPPMLVYFDVESQQIRESYNKEKGILWSQKSK